MVTYQDPYVPHQRRPVVREAVLPVARLVRLGASMETAAVLQQWFTDLPETGRKVAAQQMALRSDSGLAEWVLTLNAIPEASVANVLAWVGLQSNKTAAQVALIFEERRESPRSTLVSKLQALL